MSLRSSATLGARRHERCLERRRVASNAIPHALDAIRGGAGRVDFVRIARAALAARRAFDRIRWGSEESCAGPSRTGEDSIASRTVPKSPAQGRAESTRIRSFPARLPKVLRSTERFPRAAEASCAAPSASCAAPGASCAAPSASCAAPRASCGAPGASRAAPRCPCAAPGACCAAPRHPAQRRALPARRRGVLRSTGRLSRGADASCVAPDASRPDPSRSAQRRSLPVQRRALPARFAGIPRGAARRRARHFS
jgi:hypothetical protein